MNKQIAAWAWAPVIAIQFLTRIPLRGVPDWAYEDSAGRGKSFAFYPLVGALVGSIGATVLWLAHRLHLPPAASAIAAVLSTAAVTGALHEDGLADVADGLGPHNREDALKAMRDSRLGSFGTIALWGLLTLKVVAISSLSAESVCKAIIAAHVFARWSPLPLAKMMSLSPFLVGERGRGRVVSDAAATPGLGASMAAALSTGAVLMATLITAALTVPLLGPTAAERCGIGACLLIVATGLFYRARFGGITGDCLGATNQIVEVATLFLMLKT